MSNLILDTVDGVVAALEREEAVYEASRNALLKNHQDRRKHLRALLDVLRDEAANKKLAKAAKPAAEMEEAEEAET